MLIAIRYAISTHLLISVPPKSKQFLGFQFEEPKRFVCSSEKSLMSSSKIVVEYAKSNRSSCKKCSKSIGKDAPRLGLLSRDARGFDMPKWHHLECFQVDSDAIGSVEAIKGFTALKSFHQEALRKLVDGHGRTPEEDSDGSNDVAEGTNESSKELMVQKRDRDIENDLCKQNLKKIKLSMSHKEAELDMSFSVSDIMDKYKDATLLPKWKAYQTLIFLERDDGLRDSSKIAAFDFDGCLAKTSVRRVGADAWSLMYPSIPNKLQSLYNDGYKLVIFTNESNIERWKNKRQTAINSKLGRLNSFIKQVNVPVQVFVACGLGQSAEDPFRKPKTGMWQIMEKHLNSGIAIDVDQSFYVGDAAGRPTDHSDADKKFAEIIGLQFYVPEEYFDT